jgi:AAA+ superfamily predicted ATPase
MTRIIRNKDLIQNLPSRICRELVTSLEQDQWRALNDRFVLAAVAWVRALLAARMERPAPVVRRVRQQRSGFLAWLFGSSIISEEVVEPVNASTAEPGLSPAEAEKQLRTLEAEFEAQGSVSSLRQLASRFDLSPFETHVLLLCLAFELDTRVGWMCGQIQDRPHRPYPTFGLAMTLFSDSDWLALPPEKPLRRCRLVDLRQPAGTPLFGAELRLEETVLHYLRAVPSLDGRLAMLAAPVPASDAALTSAQQVLVDRITSIISDEHPRRALVQLVSTHAADAQRIVSAVTAGLGWRLFRSTVDGLAADTEEVAKLWQRESTLYGLALALDAHDTTAQGDAFRSSSLLRFAGSVKSPLFLLSRERLPLPGVKEVCLEIAGAAAHDQAAMWRQQFPKGLADPQQFSGELSQQFTFDASAAQDAVAAVLQQKNGKTVAGFPRLLWQECRERSRPRLEGLAQRIDVKAAFDDLVLSPDRHQILRQICGHVRNRWRVYDQWGWSGRMNRGLGISALFAGESGTGKTMAAEVLANALNLDLYHVDLSSVVSKYIGETEKHLRRLFDAFESCGAILFFDECDALFGKRSEVKDSHDRYANIEINYLLQRLESYRGVAILATNNRGALDPAFLRRLRFVVTFPMPSEMERDEIWRKLLPPVSDSDPPDGSRIPVEPLDYERLAQLQFVGGNIHNVVLNAAFRAASRTTKRLVTMSDVMAAAKDEYLKLERPINEADFAHGEAVVEEALL